VNAPEAFAKAHAVSEHYAWGVSDGFEGEDMRGTGFDSHDFFMRFNSDDYIRGVEVGKAAASAMNPSDKYAPDCELY
jgi:hypothetical protein